MCSLWDSGCHESTSFTKNHRIRECFGLEGTFRGHLAQPSEQGHLQPDQVAQSPVQPDLECFQGWGIDHLSEQPVPAPLWQKIYSLYLV